MLSRLSFVLQNQDFKAALKRQAPREELMDALSRAEAAIPACNTAQSNGNTQYM
jgi:hypothetical protein